MTDHHRFALRAHYPLIDAVSAAPLLTAAEIHAYPIGILVSHAVMVKDVTILGICRPLAPAQPKGLVWENYAYGRCGGILMYYPLAFAFGDGI